MNGKFIRLTKKGKSKVDGKEKTLCTEFNGALCVALAGNCALCSTNDKVWDRLAEFEEFGLHPHEIKYFLSQTCTNTNVDTEVNNKKVKEG